MKQMLNVSINVAPPIPLLLVNILPNFAVIKQCIPDPHDPLHLLNSAREVLVFNLCNETIPKIDCKQRRLDMMSHGISMTSIIADSAF